MHAISLRCIALLFRFVGASQQRLVMGKVGLMIANEFCYLRGVDCERFEWRCPATFRYILASGHVLPLPAQQQQGRLGADRIRGGEKRVVEGGEGKASDDTEGIATEQGCV